MLRWLFRAAQLLQTLTHSLQVSPAPLPHLTTVDPHYGILIS